MTGRHHHKIGEIVELLGRTKYRDARLGWFLDWIDFPLRLKQAELIRGGEHESDYLVGCATWAFLDDRRFSQALQVGLGALHPSEWNEGANTFVNFFIARSDRLFSFARQLQRRSRLSGLRVGYVRQKSGRLKVVVLQGRNINVWHLPTKSAVPTAATALV